MKKLVIVIAILAGILNSAGIWAAPNPGKPFDLQGYIDKQLKARKRHIRIPPGRYRVKPNQSCHLKFENLKGVVIDARGVEMICTETTRAVTISKCSNFMLLGLVIDYDPLPYTQGRIVNISADGMVHDIEIMDGYPTEGDIDGHKYEIFNSDTRELAYGSYHRTKVTRTGPGKLQAVKADHYKGKDYEKVGDIIAVNCLNAPSGYSVHCLYVESSQNVVIDSVTMYASNCFGFYERYSKGTVYCKCTVARRPLKTDLKQREEPRIRSLNADAYHSKYALVGPSYIQCKAGFQGDDCIAINGDYHMIMKAEGKKLRVIAKQTFNIEAGDPLELIAYTGERLPDAKALRIKAVGEINAAERAFLKKQPIRDQLKDGSSGFTTKAFEVIINRPLDLPQGSLIAAANRVGNGFKIIDCEMGFNRSRGFLIKAGDGEIRGNVVDSTWSQGIIVNPEYYWFEGGSGNNIIIKDNIVRNCKSTAIYVSAKGGSGTVSPAGAHDNIKIIGNTVETSPAPQIMVTSTTDLEIKGNTINAQDETLSDDQAIQTEHCPDPVIRDNTVK